MDKVGENARRAAVLYRNSLVHLASGGARRTGDYVSDDGGDIVEYSQAIMLCERI